MALFKIILLMGCMTFAASLNCTYTGCERQIRDGFHVCKEYGYEYFIGETIEVECSSDKMRFRCCNKEKGCEWAVGCHSSMANHTAVCYREFRGKLTPKDKKRCKVGDVDIFVLFSLECCPPES